MKPNRPWEGGGGGVYNTAYAKDVSGDPIQCTEKMSPPPLTLTPTINFLSFVPDVTIPPQK